MKCIAEAETHLSHTADTVVADNSDRQSLVVEVVVAVVAAAEDKAALKTQPHWRQQPRLRIGVRIAVVHTVPIHMVLGKGRDNSFERLENTALDAAAVAVVLEKENYW